MTLDEPFELEPNTMLITTVLPKSDAEHDSWLRLSGKRLEEAYSEGEPEYSLDLIKEAKYLVK